MIINQLRSKDSDLIRIKQYPYRVLFHGWCRVRAGNTGYFRKFVVAYLTRQTAKSRQTRRSRGLTAFRRLTAKAKFLLETDISLQAVALPPIPLFPLPSATLARLTALPVQNSPDPVEPTTKSPHSNPDPGLFSFDPGRSNIETTRSNIGRRHPNTAPGCIALWDNRGQYWVTAAQPWAGPF